MKEFLKSQFDEVRQNKLRVGILTLILLGTLIFAANDFEKAEEIKLDEPATNSTSKNFSPTNEKIKAVIGASNEEFYVYNPFQNPSPPAEKVEPPAKVEETPVKVEEKVPPPVIIAPPVEKVVEVPKPPEEKFILRGTALGTEKSALVEKIVEGKSEMLFLKIGDKINGKIISDIDTDFIKFDDGSIINIEIS